MFIVKDMVYMHDKKRERVLKLILSMIIVLLITTITYAFYSIFVSNENAQVGEVTSATISLTYTDCADTNAKDCANITASLKPGDSVTKTFQIENTGTGTANYDLYFTKIQNTFKNNDLVYKIEDLDTGEIYMEETPVPYFESMSYNQTIKSSTIGVGEVKKYKMTITFLNRAIDQSDNLNASFSLTLGLVETTPSKLTLQALGLNSKSETPDFNTTATTDETADGLYAMEDDYGTSYYFRGAVENNYVYFASYYWRIIRINGDGSLRIIYDGTIAHANGESSKDRLVSTSVAFNSSSKDNAYVGYMYGTTGSNSYEATHANTNNSTIKTYLDNWYKTNIVDKGYGEAVSDEIFCNDRSIDTSIGTGLGYGTNQTGYGAIYRLSTNKSPQLTCTQKNDAFTVDDEEKGNGNLTYPVGLITADEIALAGGKWNYDNSSYYLYKGSYYWSLSPYGYFSGAFVFGVYGTGSLSNYIVITASGAAPVINLNANYCQRLGGVGSKEDPYTVG